MKVHLSVKLGLCLNLDICCRNHYQQYMHKCLPSNNICKHEQFDIDQKQISRIVFLLIAKYQKQYPVFPSSILMQMKYNTFPCIFSTHRYIIVVYIYIPASICMIISTCMQYFNMSMINYIYIYVVSQHYDIYMFVGIVIYTDILVICIYIYICIYVCIYIYSKKFVVVDI